MDISETLAPTSDQLDAIELVAGPRTFTVEAVSAGSDEQPVQIRLAEFPRVWRPGKSMRRVLAAGWGVDASTWIGHRVTLVYDGGVMFGKDRVGGTRISAMSHLKDGKRLTVPLLISRGKSAMFTVEPLPNVAPTTLARMPEETSDRIEALMVRLELDDGKERAATSWATNGRTDDWTTLTPDESTRLIGFLESKLPADPAETPGREPLL